MLFAGNLWVPDERTALADEGISGPGFSDFFPPRETRWITIHGTWSEPETHTWIEPFNKVYVNRNTEVIWVNQSEDKVRIKFGKGPQCREVSKSVLRVLDWRMKQGCYVTRDPIPRGGVLTIRLREQGSYHYEVEYVSKNSKQEGTVHVF